MRDGIVVVGVPIGTPKFELVHMQSVVTAKSRTLSSLQSIAELQARLHLLRYLSRPALNHLLRTVPIQHTRTEGIRHDSNVLRATEQLLALPTNSLSNPAIIKQVWLSQRNGGLGLQSCNESSVYAFIAAYAFTDKALTDRFPFLKHSTPPTPVNDIAHSRAADFSSGDTPYKVAVNDAMSTLSSLKARLSSLAPSYPKDLSEEIVAKIPTTLTQLRDCKSPLSQSFYSNIQSTLSRTTLLNEASQLTRARLLSLSGKGSQAWMQATPDNKLRMSSLSVLVACRRLLGLPLPFANPLPLMHCPHCPSHPLIDAEGNHFAVCKMGYAASILHNKINHEVLQMHKECGKYVQQEELSGLLGESGLTPDGCVYGGPSQIAVDTTVRSPLRDDLLPSSAENAGKAARVGEEEKMLKYAKVCESMDFDFLPAVFESFGAIGGRLAEHMQRLESEYHDLQAPWMVQHEGGGAFVSRWRQRFSVTLQNAMAHKIASHCRSLRVPLVSLVAVAG